MKLKEDNWYKVSIWNNEMIRDYKVCELDSRKIYEVTYGKGTDKERKDLVMIFSQVLNYVECKSILSDEKFKLVGFVDVDYTEVIEVEEEAEEEEIFMAVQVQASFPGGLKKMYEYLKNWKN